jgi:hypothetical protein
MKLLSQVLRTGLLVGAVLFALAGRSALADNIVFATNEPGGQILKVDLTTNTVTTVLSIAANPDSLVFSGKNILFTEVIQGNLADFNTTTMTVTNIATGFTQPRDLILEPGGTSTLVADFLGGTIDRVNLTTHIVTTLFTQTTTAGIDGLAYDSMGHLFAVLGRNEVAQIDPTTGAILNHTATFDGNLDGLTFDSSTGKLWVGSENGAIWEVPTSLASETSFAAGAIDGLEADGKGNLFLANFGTNVQEFNIPTSTLTDLTAVPGIDDLAPVAGIGSPTPEPSTLILFGSGLLGLAGTIRRRKCA